MDTPRTKPSSDSDSEVSNATQNDDVIICVMGCTGTGKSLFIKLLTKDTSVKVSDSLESETSEVQLVRFVDRTSGRTVALVDTPGFDDSRKGITDTVVLKKITSFLLKQYDGKRKLNGLVYLHRITDTRFGGQSKINLRMFQNLCGPEAYKNVVVLTTFWDQISSPEVGDKREMELKDNFLNGLFGGGATFMRHNRTVERAQRVLRHVLTFVPTDIQIVKEIREEGKSLEETAAGSVHGAEVERLIAKHRQEIEKIREEMNRVKEDTASMKRDLEELRDEHMKKIAQLESERVDLKNGLEEETRNREVLPAEAEKEKSHHRQWLLQRESSLPVTPTRGRGYDVQPLQRSQTEAHLDFPPPYEEVLSAQELPGGAFRFAYSEHYPPYLKTIPKQYRTDILDIFDFKSLLQTTVATFKLPDLTRLADSSIVETVRDLVERNHKLHYKVRSETRNGPISQLTLGMYFSKNIGHRDDWYSDAAFGQQQFTGTNPTTITLASSRWIEDFGTAAHSQGRGDMVKLLNSDPENLFVQNHSDFRSIVGLPPNAEISCDGRYGCSSITLFHLESQGKLHPLAIILDYKGSTEESVVIFNRRTTADTPGDEAADWPWRYAKMCAQVSDWFRHELVVHLVYTHLVEEVLIVAANRTLPPSHIVLKLLEPHWKTTLSLNEAARSTLVPKIINEMTAFKDPETYAFIKDAYQRFDWVGSYVPNDLRRRGFPVEKLNDVKYHNYGYARNIARMWEILRKFVGTVLTKTYVGGDAQVAADLSIASFCRQVRSIDGGQLGTFPSIKTLDELIDFVTMCIHIASPQHTAVNYLQQYYQTFVPNKPSALFRPLPQSLAELQGYREKDILDALPSHRSRDWLLMAQVPYLLSMEVAEDSTILHYAATTINSNSTPRVIREAAEAFKYDLQVFAQTVSQYSEELDDQQTPYLVLDPYRTAISILI